MDQKIAVILPCYNEEQAIAKVIQEFRSYLPQASIYVYDNNSQDNTVAEAKNAGAIVAHETRQGKGYVIRRAFADVDADIYIMADGDGTYDASVAAELIQTLRTQQLDMLVGARQDSEPGKLYRPGHKMGNWMLTNAIGVLFGFRFKDVLSGYRVFSRRFVKSFPALATGFEIEAMLTVHALELDLPTEEMPTRYFERVEGTQSKLRTYHDGLRILLTIINLFRQFRPLWFYGLFATFFTLISTGIMLPIWLEYVQMGLVERFPSAFLSVGVMVCALISLVCGLIMEHASRNHREKKYLQYLRYSAPKTLKNNEN